VSRFRRESSPRPGLPQDSGRNITAAADGDHEVWLEVIEDIGCRNLAELVHLGDCQSFESKNVRGEACVQKQLWGTACCPGQDEAWQDGLTWLYEMYSFSTMMGETEAICRLSLADRQNLRLPAQER
jgi:hypothetical protein